MSQPNSVAADLCSFIDASPSPFHVTETVASRLEAGGFRRLREVDAWPAAQGRYYVVRGGSLVAWSNEGAEGAGCAVPDRRRPHRQPQPAGQAAPRPVAVRAGSWLGVEPTAGSLLNSWLDRDLGLSGRVTVARRRRHAFAARAGRPAGAARAAAGHPPRPRGRHERAEAQPAAAPGRRLGRGDAARSRSPGSSPPSSGSTAADVLGWELMTHDLTPSRVVGRDGDLVSAPRMDNQVTCFAGTTALLQEVGRAVRAPSASSRSSTTRRSAASPTAAPRPRCWQTVLERIVLAAGGAREDLHRALAGSVVASGDMAHATHPNYVEKHEPQHQIAVNGGPVLKVHPNLRYATDAPGAAAFALACEQAGVPLQRYEHRADLPCGSTVGPITAGGLGVTTVDVGAPQLAMHSARELCGAQDPGMYVASLAAFLSPAG